MSPIDGTTRAVRWGRAVLDLRAMTHARIGRRWALPLVVGGLGVAAGLLGWVLSGTGLLPPSLAVHAALMIVAWGMMMPLGGLLARYFKVTPAQDYPAIVDNPLWWNWHRGLQYGGLAVSSLAVAVVLTATGGRIGTLHGAIGLGVMTLGWLQVLSALLRGGKGGATDKGADRADPSTWRGDHYDMTRRRRLFEAWHKPAGWLAILLAGITILLGIDLVGALPWLMLLAGMLQGAALWALVDGRLRGRWVDTYAALWGPDPAHPGNRRTGIARHPRSAPPQWPGRD